MLSHRQLFLKHLGQTSDSPMMLEIDRAEGLYLYDHSGKEYIDLISGIGVSSVGHRHPAILKAIHTQSEKYLHLMVYGEYVQSPQVLLAKALCDSLPASLNSCFFVNSGSEATEGAMKLAKRYTGRSRIISCKDAYHGATHGALSLGSVEDFKRPFRPLLPNIDHITFGALEDIDKINQKTAAVIIETVQGEAGVKTASKAYWQKLKQQCQKNGVLLILDEIQCGIGRTGKFWAFEHYDIEPDIVLTAKGLGGGMPIGAFIAHKEVMDTFQSNPVLGHITTFGGHPLSAATALATVNVLSDQNLIDRVHEKEERFKTNLKHKSILEIRNLGLMMALQFDSFDTVKKIIDKALEYGIITDWFLFCDDAIRIAPPLTINFEQIDECCSKLLRAIKAVS